MEIFLYQLVRLGNWFPWSCMLDSQKVGFYEGFSSEKITLKPEESNSINVSFWCFPYKVLYKSSEENVRLLLVSLWASKVEC